MKESVPIGTRVYRPSKKSRIFFAIMGGFGFAGGVWILANLAPWSIAQFRENPRPTSLLLCCFNVAIGGFMVIQSIAILRSYWKRAIVLTSNSVTVEFLYGTRTLRFGDILGRRTQPTQYGQQTVIVPKAKQFRKLIIKDGCVVDDYYRNWLASLPDLDAIDKERRRAEGKLHFGES